MDKLIIVKDDNTNVTYIKSDKQDTDFTVDLLEHFLKQVLFEHTIYVFITFNKSMEQVSYIMLDVDVDNIHGYTIPLSELDDNDLQYVSIMGMDNLDKAINWIKVNTESYLEEIGNMKVCLELPYDGVIDNVFGTEIVHRIKDIAGDNCEIILGSKYGNY